jgi:hypothetical protein
MQEVHVEGENKCEQSLDGEASWKVTALETEKAIRRLHQHGF